MTKKNLLISLAGIVLIATVSFATWLILKSDSSIAYHQITVENGDITKEIKATGQINPASNVDLAWEKSGKIAAVSAQVGDKVTAGQVLLALNNSDLSAQVGQAQANLQVTQAQLNQITNGARPEELALKQIELDKANQDLNNYYNNSLAALHDAYAKADEAVRRQTVDLFTNGDSTALKLNILTSNSQLEINLVNQRLKINSDLKQWEDELSGLSADQDQAKVDQAVQNGKDYLAEVREYLNLATDAVNISVNWNAATIATEKTSIDAGRTAVNAAIASVNLQKQSLDTQKINLRRIQQEFDLMKTGARQEDIAAATARVAQARAAVQLAQAGNDKNYLRAPIDGVIARISGKVGEIAAPGLPVVSIISAAQNEIETRLSEADVAKVHVGDTASVTIDAFANQSFAAHIVSIELSPSVGTDGMNGYKVKLQLTDNNDQIKNGMTANINIAVAHKSQALVLPQSVLSRNNDEYFVTRPNGTKQLVQTGIWGSDDKVEILSGLNLGDTVLGLGK